MTQKNKEINDRMKKALANSSLTNEQIMKRLPMMWSYLKGKDSGRNSSLQDNILLGLLAEKAFQDELRNFDDFKEFDFSPYTENAEQLKNLPKDLESADIETIRKWYDTAKRTIDPKGRLKNTELYDTAGPSTFENLDRLDAGTYDDWFGNLLDALGYPDTPEGYEQLTKDIPVVMTRMKNSDFANKFGKAKAPLSFVFGNTFDVLEDGKKPTLADVAIDAGTNIAWSVPAANMIPGVSKVVGWLPKTEKVSEAVLKLNSPKSIAGKLAKNIGTNAAVPTTSKMADYMIGTDTEKEKKEGFKGKLQDALMGTAVNFATPQLLKLLPNRTLPVLNNVNMTPEEIAYANGKIGDFLEFGSVQDAAAQRLANLLNKKDEAAEIVKKFASRIGKRRGPISLDRSTDAVVSLPGIMQGRGMTLAEMIRQNNGSLSKGSKAFLKSFDSPILEDVLRKTSEIPKSLADYAKPILATYAVNRAGTDGVGKFIERIFSRQTNKFEDDEK